MTPEIEAPTPAGDEGLTTDGLPKPAAPPSVDRAAAFSAGPQRIPRKFVYIALAFLAVLGLGGLLGEHVVSALGLNPTPPPPSATTTTVAHPAPSSPSSGPGVDSRSLSSSLSSFMGLEPLTPSPAPTSSLVNQVGQPAPVGGVPGRVTVLTFFDAPCDDICPIVAAEIDQADALLGPLAARVSFVTVNTDPDATAVSALSAVLTRTALGHLSNWQMLTGPLETLNAVWRAYGVTVTVTIGKTDVVSHNDVMYFVDAQGDLRFRATPVADESLSRTYSLPAPDVTRWAHGIATYATELLPAQ